MSKHEFFGGLALMGLLGLAGLIAFPWLSLLLVWSGIAKLCPPVVTTLATPLWLAISLVAGAVWWGISRLFANPHLR